MGGRFDESKIAEWINSGEHFEARSDGNGLSLCFREGYQSPTWKLRYRQNGKQCVLVLGNYRHLPLQEARKLAAEYRRQLAAGVDIAAAHREVKTSEQKLRVNSGHAQLSKAFASLLAKAAVHGARSMTVTIQFDTGESESWAS